MKGRCAPRRSVGSPWRPQPPAADLDSSGTRPGRPPPDRVGARELRAWCDLPGASLVGQRQGESLSCGPTKEASYLFPAGSTKRQGCCCPSMVQAAPRSVVELHMESIRMRLRALWRAGTGTSAGFDAPRASDRMPERTTGKRTCPRSSLGVAGPRACSSGRTTTRKAHACGTGKDRPVAGSGRPRSTTGPPFIPNASI